MLLRGAAEIDDEEPGSIPFGPADTVGSSFTHRPFSLPASAASSRPFFTMSAYSQPIVVAPLTSDALGVPPVWLTG